MRKRRSPESIDAYLGKRIREYRLLHGLTQHELAERIGVKFQQLQKYEVASNKCSISRLVKIAEVLDIPLSQLLGKYVGKDESTDVEPDSQSIRMIKDYQNLPKNLKKVVGTLTASLAEKMTELTRRRAACIAFGGDCLVVAVPVRLGLLTGFLRLANPTDCLRDEGFYFGTIEEFFLHTCIYACKSFSGRVL